MELKDYLVSLRDVFISSWKTISILSAEDESDFFKQNWLQANWEMILESFLSQREGNLVLLDYYGEGSEDLHYSLLKGQEGVNRVSLPSMNPTHTITCRPINENLLCRFSSQRINFPENGLVFGEFTSLVENRIIQEPPFDYVVLVAEPFDFVVPFDELTYHLTPINSLLRK